MLATRHKDEIFAFTSVSHCDEPRPRHRKRLEQNNLVSFGIGASTAELGQGPLPRIYRSILLVHRRPRSFTGVVCGPRYLPM